MIPSFVFRAKSRQIMKKAMHVLIVLALAATLPSLIASTVTIITQSDPSLVISPFYAQLRTLLSDAETPAESLLTQLTALLDQFNLDIAAYMAEKGPIYLAMTVMSLLLTPALSMGLYHALMQTLRGQEVSVQMAWPGVKRFFKGIGTNLLSLLLVLLWMLLPLLAGMAVFLLTPSTAGMLAYVVGLAASAVLAIRAAYSYAMALYIVADEPSTGMFAAIRRSRKAMHGRRKELFFLEVSFIGWTMLLNMAQLMLQMMFGGVIGMTLGMFAQLFLTLYKDGAKIAFYEAYVVHGVKRGQSVPMEEDKGPDLTEE